MKRDELLFFILAVIALAFLAVNANQMTGRSIEDFTILEENNCTGAAGETCECSNCSDCIDAINSGGNGATIRLNANINSTGSCINIPRGNLSNKTFDCAYFVIEGNTTGTGISAAGIEGATITRCAVGNFEGGIIINDSQNNFFTNNSVYLNSESSFSLINSSHNTLENNFVYNNTNYGLYLEYSNNNTLTANTFYDNIDGADITGNLNSFSDNEIYSNTNGIYLYTAYNTTFDGDEIYDNSYGLLIDSCENTTLTRIEAYYNDYSLYIQYSYNTTVLDSTLRDSDGGYGIYSTGSYYDAINKNIFRNNTNGIYSNSQLSQIAENTFEDNSYGILGFADAGNVYENNILRENNESGFYMQRTNSGIIRNNSITGSQYAINLLESSSSTCTGIVQACSSFTNQISCNAQQGCFWNSMMGTCGGIATPCALLVRVGCTSQANCNWVTSYYNDEWLNISNNILSTGLAGIYIDGRWSTPRNAVTKGGYHIILNNEISDFDIGIYLNDANHNEINGTILSGSAQEDILAYDYGSSPDNKIRDASFDGLKADIDYAGQFNISGSLMQGNAPSGYTDIDKFLRITDSSGSGGTVNLTLYYSDSDLTSISDESTLGLWLYSGTDWNEVDYTLDASANSIKSDLSSFGNLGIFGDEKEVSSGGGSTGGAAYGTYDITAEQLLAGYTKSLAAKGGLRFAIEGEVHKIRVISVSSEGAILEIASNPQNVSFLIGDEKKFDFNEDGIYDLSVKLNKLDDSKKTADLTVLGISERVYASEETVSGEEVAAKEYPLQTETSPTVAVIIILTAAITLIIFFVRHVHKIEAPKKVKSKKRK